MNTKKLAEALRKAADSRGTYAMYPALRDAAAACEEEGDDEALARKDVWDTLVRHCERIEALEAKQNAIAQMWRTESRRIDRLENAAALAARSASDDTPPAPDRSIATLEEDLRKARQYAAPAPEEPRCNGCRNCKKAGSHVCGCHDPVPAAPDVHACVEWQCPLHHPNDFTPAAASAARSVSDDTPPAPEERCFHGVPGTACRACNGPAPPEQAQETDAPLKMTPHPRETCRALDPPCVSCAPEQAQEALAEFGRKLAADQVDMPPEVAAAIGSNLSKLYDTTPPEQARRTETFRRRWEGVASINGVQVHPMATVTELRHGERIVSGEGVPMHEHSNKWYRDAACLHPDQEFHARRGVGLFYPDAPPRAEEIVSRLANDAQKAGLYEPEKK